MVVAGCIEFASLTQMDALQLVFAEVLRAILFEYPPSVESNSFRVFALLRLGFFVSLLVSLLFLLHSTNIYKRQPLQSERMKEIVKTTLTAVEYSTR